MNILFKFLGAFIAGAGLLLGLSFTIYRKSYYYKKAMAEAGLGEKPAARSRLVTAAMMFAMIAFFALFDLWVVSGEARSFVFLAALNLGLIAFLSLFDALFTDYFVLVVWRPACLHMPEGQPTRESMLRHIKLQLTAGWIFKVPIAILGATLFSIFSKTFF